MGRTLPESSAAMARRAIEIQERGEFFNALALALFRLGELREALEAASRSCQLAPEVPEFHYDRGRILEALGEGGRARIAFLRALRLDPDFEEAEEALTRLDEAEPA